MNEYDRTTQLFNEQKEFQAKAEKKAKALLDMNAAEVTEAFAAFCAEEDEAEAWEAMCKAQTEAEDRFFRK